MQAAPTGLHTDMTYMYSVCIYVCIVCVHVVHSAGTPKQASNVRLPEGKNRQGSGRARIRVGGW